ncbi:MAG: DoxX [Candidatus Parcubacteria bacterium]|jgi:uncharacterized membrane protein YphA (DoxX/SURF4 family)
MKTGSAAAIRYAMALTFLWFGIRQLQVPVQFVGFLPEWMGYVPVPGEMVVRLNGWFEVVASIMLLLGLETRLAALLLGVHLMGIAAAVGDAIGVRDAGLAAATLALAFSPADEITLDARFREAKGGATPVEVA